MLVIEKMCTKNEKFPQNQLKHMKTNLKTSLLIVILFVVASVQAQTLEWAKSFGSISNDVGRSIAIDDSGNIYTTGYFIGTVDFALGLETVSLTSVGARDIFIHKMDANGNLLWAKSFGGISSDEGSSIALDGFGNVYSLGVFRDTVDFDSGAGISKLTSKGERDIFIHKMDVNGNFLWAKSFGANADDIGFDIILDGFGNILTTGYFHGTIDFDPGTGINNHTSVGSDDIFIHKMDANGNFLWAKSFGGTSFDSGRSLALDTQGNIYTTGFFRETANFNSGEGFVNLTSAGENDVFVHKMDSNGNFLWVKSFGGFLNDVGSSIVLDASGYIYILGYFNDIVDFNPGLGISNLTSIGSSDVFVQKMDENGNFLWVKSFGGYLTDLAYSIKVDAFNNIYVIGAFSDTVDFDPGLSSSNITSTGSSDVFIHKMDENGIFLWVKSYGGILTDVGYSLVLDASGNIYTTGSFYNDLDFVSDTGVNNLTSAGNEDIFVIKMSQNTAEIIENGFGHEVLIYPNPSNGNFSVDLGKNYHAVKIKITDLNSRIILAKEYSNTQLLNLKLHETAGIYLLTIESAENRAVIRLVKE
jgi:hypothetical protein